MAADHPGAGVGSRAPLSRPPLRATGSSTSNSLSMIEGCCLRDLFDQPRALQNAVGGLIANDTLAGVARKLADGTFRRIMLTGMGGSLHAW